MPVREYTGDSEGGRSSWQKRCVRHISTVIEGRSTSLIYVALVRNGQLQDLLELPGIRKQMAQAASDSIQKHWTPRLAVHLWDRLELSREECNTERHLLSFRYEPKPVDRYIPLRLWENPDDPDDFVSFPILPARHAREKEYRTMVQAAEIQVSASGHACERNAVVAASEMYSAYRKAMRSNFSAHRPAMPIYYFDGTGQSLGKGLCHAELGSADFVGECKQSRRTLQPLQASEGNDHAMSIRDTMAYAAKSFNKLIEAAEIELLDGGMNIPAKPIASADFQAVKAMTATSEQTHSVWCKCLAGDHQHRYCKEPIKFDPGRPANILAAYNRMLKFIVNDEAGPKCLFKSFDDLCVYNHVPPSIARGGRFQRFKCEECGYNPTELQWTSDVSEFNQCDDDEQKVKRKAHRENGCTEHRWNRHYFGELFMYPLVQLDCKDIGVDMLHLIYLNIFKHLFNYTIHQPLPGGSSLPDDPRCPPC